MKDKAIIKVLLEAGTVSYENEAGYWYAIETNHGVLEIHKCCEYCSKIVAAYPKGIWLGVTNGV